MIDAVAIEHPLPHHRFEFAQAAHVHAEGDPRIEGGQPPGHRAAHRYAHGADKPRVHVRTGDEVVDGPHGVMDHHAPQHPPLPQHLLEQFPFRADGPFAESPGVNGKGGIPEAGEKGGVARCEQVPFAPVPDEFVLADPVHPAMGMVEQHGGERSRRAFRFHETSGHRLQPVQLQFQRFQHVSVPFFHGFRLCPNRTAPRRQIAEERQQPAAPFPFFRCHVNKRPSFFVLSVSVRSHVSPQAGRFFKTRAGRAPFSPLPGFSPYTDNCGCGARD